MNAERNASDNLRVALVGLGYFSQFHLDSWQRMEGAKLVAVCDQEPARLKEVEEKTDVRAYTDIAELCATEAPDIVDLVVPPSAHALAIESAAAAGRLVVCQKPFCEDLSEARRMVELASQCDCDLVVHENFRFQPWYRTIKAMLESNELGEVMQSRFALRPGDGRGADAYLARQPAFRKMQKFLVHETGVHFIDLHRWLFGEVKSVYADLRQLNPNIAGEDAGVILFEHVNGIRSVFDGNRLLDHPADDRRKTMGEMNIEGTDASIHLDGEGAVRIRKFETKEWQLVDLKHEVDPVAFGGGCVHALNQHLVTNFRNRQFENTAREYLRVIEIEQAVYDANHHGRSIAL